jgi:MoaA/NifB/PqqE/SkfB family radical SAM enzyme
MCTRRLYKEDKELIEATSCEVEKYLPEAKAVVLSGIGDPFCIPYVRDWLTSKDGKYPDLEFDLITNGLLIADYWEKIKHRKFGPILISIDAATKETYERVRVGGDWDKLHAGLAIVRKNRDRFASVATNMTVMRLNYREIPAFIDMAESYGFDTSFQQVRGTFGEQNIFAMKDSAALEELSLIVKAERDKKRSVGIVWADILEYADLTDERTPRDTGEMSQEAVPELNISEVLSYEDYEHHARHYQEAISTNSSFEKNLIPDNCSEFTVTGYCYVCRTSVDFLVDFKYSYKVDGVLTPNWRERLVCPGCHLNNRMRAVVHIFNQTCRPHPGSSIYMTEQTTALYQLFKQSFPDACGSEYLGDSVEHGACNREGMRNEDLTKLSFGNEQFDYILSFDVLEHIPNYRKALGECCRCLRPGGILFFTVPFVKTSKKNIVRARVSDTGEVIHVLPPEYHGDPMRSDGCLAFYQFGWEILDELKIMGFQGVKALLYWSQEFGYLGGEQVLFSATKIPQPENAGTIPPAVEDKNRQYDIQTLEVMKRVLQNDSNCVDVGCHQGSILREMLRFGEIQK